MSLPSPSRDHQVGTDKVPYKLSNSDVMRHRAIESHIYEKHHTKLSKMEIQKPTKRVKQIIRNTVQSLKKRLNLIRIYQRNNPLNCEVLTKDMLWMDKKFGDGMSTSNIC